MTTRERLKNKFLIWFLEGIRQRDREKETHQDWWPKVMCLTGVDYFSTLGYQPGIAYLAAGLLSPFATFILIILTLFGALPVYSTVSRISPHGQGSLSLLSRLFPGWRGKTFVLVLLGFACTDFIITITLSAADATAHIVENPLIQQAVPAYMLDRVVITLGLLGLLGMIFLTGFKEAIGLSTIIVSTYLIVNAVTIGVALDSLFHQPQLFLNWQNRLTGMYHSIWPMIGMSMLVFPKLALGLSGFETGVAVMPHVRGNPDDTPENPAGRIKNTRKLLLTAALIMGCLLLTSSLATSLLIPPEAFVEGGDANGRAISYLAHELLGHTWGSVYDVCTIAILWFAGASALAGLLNLVPRYMPRYGMAPGWSAAMRPLVVFFLTVAFAVTLIFKANVDAQAGAYATGVLVLMTCDSFAVTLTYNKISKIKRNAFLVITLVFGYTLIANIIERPEGLHIASFFIGAILISSLLSRTVRALELRIQKVSYDDVAESFFQEALLKEGEISILSHRPGGMEYTAKEAETRRVHKLTPEEAQLIFLEVTITDASEFIDNVLHVTGHLVDGNKVLRCESSAVPNAIAAIMLDIRDRTKTIPHAYFGWTEGHPLGYVFKYIFLGEGEIAPVTREILRATEPDPEKRPKIHVS